MSIKCNLIIDSCCDLPASMVVGEGIKLLQFPYVLSDGTHYDDLFSTMTPKEFYDLMRKGEQPSTAQVALPHLRAAFEWAVQEGLPTVYLSFTAGLSGSFDAACIMREQILADHPDFELYVVDTLQASVTEGLFVLEAMRQREKGMTAKELVEWAEEARYYVDELFMIEDLDVLKRGGRISPTVALAGGKLDVKPMLNIDVDGTLSVAGIARGRKKGMKQLVSYYEKNHSVDGDNRIVFVGSADCDHDADRLVDMIQKSDPDAIVMRANIGPVIGSHVGPGMIAVVFWGNDKRGNLSISDRIARAVKGA